MQSLREPLIFCSHTALPCDSGTSTKAIIFLNECKLLQVLHYRERKKARVPGFSLAVDWLENCFQCGSHSVAPYFLTTILISLDNLRT
jgi:hypothetical protein